MKCYVLSINRGIAKLYRTAKFESSIGFYKKGVFGKRIDFFIPDKSEFLLLEMKGNKKIPLIHVDELTNSALSVIKTPQGKMSKYGSITISSTTDPTTQFKLNTLIKGSFWEMLAKRLKLGLVMTLIYLFAGGGIILFSLEVISILFLKKHLFG